MSPLNIPVVSANLASLWPAKKVFVVYLSWVASFFVGAGNACSGCMVASKTAKTTWAIPPSGSLTLCAKFPTMGADGVVVNSSYLVEAFGAAIFLLRIFVGAVKCCLTPLALLFSWHIARQCATVRRVAFMATIRLYRIVRVELFLAAFACLRLFIYRRASCFAFGKVASNIHGAFGFDVLAAAASAKQSGPDFVFCHGRDNNNCAYKNLLGCTLDPHASAVRGG